MPNLMSPGSNAAVNGVNGATSALGSNPFAGGGIAAGVGSLFNLFNNPYEAGMDAYGKYAQQGANAQNPFLKAGTGAIGNYQDWLKTMKDPSGFINNIMGQYQQSPFAQYQQQQSLNATNNMGSATGLTGSSPLQLQAQQNAQNISSQDMNQWLQNVLGVNTQYGAGQGNLINTGANSANALTKMYSDMANWMGEQSSNSAANTNQSWSNLIAGGAHLFGF